MGEGHNLQKDGIYYHEQKDSVVENSKESYGKPLFAYNLIQTSEKQTQTQTQKQSIKLHVTSFSYEKYAKDK